MKPVERDEILDWVTYEERRDAVRRAILEVKATRRVSLGRYLTLLFENHDTMRYQVQEMVRTERMVREADIRHELATYNELLGGDGELGTTLLVEIDDPAERGRLLPRWLALPEHLYLRLEDGRRVRAAVDERQRDERLSAVQYLKFDVGGEVPVAFGVDLEAEDLVEEVLLGPETRAALAEDLAGARA